MKFENYFSIIKSNVIKKIFNDDLCRLLFDSIITPLDLMNKNGDVEGSEAAFTKYKLFHKLEDEIYDALDWCALESQFCE